MSRPISVIDSSTLAADTTIFRNGGSTQTGVQSVTAGTNVTITGTATNPIVNASGGGGGGSTVDFYGYYGSGAPIDISTDGTYTIPLDTELFKNTLLHDNVTNNSRVTVPSGQAGPYVIVGGVTPINSAGGASWYTYQLDIVLNGTTLLASSLWHVDDAANENHSKLQTAVVVELADSDYVELSFNKVSSPGDSAAEIDSNTQEINFLSMARVQANGGGTGTVTSVATGTGLTGGPITSAGTIAIANTAVTPGSYTLMNATVNQQGQITAASSGSGSFVDTSTNQSIGGNKTFTGDTVMAQTILEAWDIGGAVYNVKAYGALGDGGTNDATAIDDTVAAALADASGAGGVVFFPPGDYVYNGTGIAVSSASASVSFVGCGPWTSQITFTSVSNANCISITGTGTLSGADRNIISGLGLNIQSGKTGILISDLEQPTVSNLRIYGGGTALKVSECRYGIVQNCHFTQWSATGILIVAESFADMTYRDIVMEGTGGTGISWIKAGTTDTGGIMFDNIQIFGGSTMTAGLAISFTTLSGAFAFLRNITSEFSGASAGPPISLTKVDSVYVMEPYAANDDNVSGVGILLDGCQSVSVIGGRAYGLAGAISLKNSCNQITVVGTQCEGGTASILVDSTTQTKVDIDIPTPTSGAVSNNFTKFRGRLESISGFGSAVASASTITPTGDVFHVTGTTTITDMTVLQAGKRVTIIFDNVLTFTDGNHLKLAGNMSTTADDTITLVSDGSNWYETGRSAN